MTASMKQLILASTAADLTLTATSFPDDHTLDLTITFHQSSASQGSFNIPLLIADIPDLLSALSDILGPIHTQYLDSTCDDDPYADANANTEPTANGLGEDILRELDYDDSPRRADIKTICKHEFVVCRDILNNDNIITKCIHCGHVTNNPLWS